MRDRVFYSMCFGFIFGVLLRSLVFVNLYTSIFFGLLAGALFLIYFLSAKERKVILLAVFLLTFSLGAIRFHISDTSAPQVFESQVDQKVFLKGTVIDEPSIGEKNQKLTVETTIGKDKTKILLTVSFGKDFLYGDEIAFQGKLEKPENFKTDTGKDFDYINYLRKDGILYVMSYANIEIISHENGNKIKSILFSVKNTFLEKITIAVPEPESLLLGGLILGEKSAFSKELREDFVRTGTIHIVALSGYNVTIVAEWFMKLFAFLPKHFGIGMGIFAVLLFVLMTGGSSTALRAGIMAVLALIARATGRNYDIGRALILAGVMMLISNPFILVYDVSFQLSFIATVAVVFLSPRIEKHFQWITTRFGLRDIVCVTTSAYIFVLPFILYKMGNLSLVALPANILVLPFVPLTMLFGFITGLVGLICQAFALPFGLVSYLMLHYELYIIRLFSDLSFASFSIPHFPLILTLIIYAYFIYFLFYKGIKQFFAG